MALCRRLLVVVLTAVLVVGLPIFTPYAMSAEEPCAMSHDEGSVPARDTACAQYCAAVCAGMALPAIQPMPTTLHSERVLVFSAQPFQSHAGQPGLQPPR